MNFRSALRALDDAVTVVAEFAVTNRAQVVKAIGRHLQGVPHDAAQAEAAHRDPRGHAARDAEPRPAWSPPRAGPRCGCRPSVILPFGERDRRAVREASRPDLRPDLGHRPHAPGAAGRCAMNARISVVLGAALAAVAGVRLQHHPRATCRSPGTGRVRRHDHDQGRLRGGAEPRPGSHGQGERRRQRQGAGGRRRRLPGPGRDAGQGGRRPARGSDRPAPLHDAAGRAVRRRHQPADGGAARGRGGAHHERHRAPRPPSRTPCRRRPCWSTAAGSRSCRRSPRSSTRSSAGARTRCARSSTGSACFLTEANATTDDIDLALTLAGLGRADAARPGRT